MALASRALGREEPEPRAVRCRFGRIGRARPTRVRPRVRPPRPRTAQAAPPSAPPACRGNSSATQDADRPTPHFLTTLTSIAPLSPPRGTPTSLSKKAARKSMSVGGSDSKKLSTSASSSGSTRTMYRPARQARDRKPALGVEREVPDQRASGGIEGDDVRAEHALAVLGDAARDAARVLLESPVGVEVGNPRDVVGPQRAAGRVAGAERDRKHHGLGRQHAPATAARRLLFRRAPNARGR